MTGGTIRVLHAATDLAAVASLFARAADYATLERGEAPPPADLAREFFEDDPPPGADPAGTLRLGLAGARGLDGIAETIFGYPEPSDAYLGLLLLAPAARGHGAGRRMLARVEDLARERGARRLLIAVLDANPRGRAFWAREGFASEAHFEGRRIGAARHDLTRMTKPL